MNNTTSSPKVMAIVRLIAMGISWASLLLVTQFGWEPLPYTDEQVTQGVFLVVTISTSLWSWYKNNPVTTYGKTKEEVGVAVVGTRKEFKEGQAETQEVEDN